MILIFLSSFLGLMLVGLGIEIYSDFKANKYLNKIGLTLNTLGMCLTIIIYSFCNMFNIPLYYYSCKIEYKIKDVIFENINDGETFFKGGSGLHYFVVNYKNREALVRVNKEDFNKFKIGDDFKLNCDYEPYYVDIKK